MSDVTQVEIEEALTRAQAIKDILEKFIDVADSINQSERIKLEEERDIDIDSKRYVPLDDLSHGEGVIRAKEELLNVDAAITTLQQLKDNKISDAEINDKFQEIVEFLESAENTRDDISAEKIIKKANPPGDNEEEW